MKILMVNNRLKVYGGEGTYMTSLGDELIKQGHDVQYFGLVDPDGLHGNSFNIYAKASNNPAKLLKNGYNRKQFARILDAFKPDIIHLNLIYFTLTPSILLESKKRGIKVVQTIHDGKMICPSYQLFIHNENKPCTLCSAGDFFNCVKHKCHKNSKLFSYIAYLEAKYNLDKGYYKLIDEFIFPSSFMRDLHVEFGVPKDKTKVICNFSRTNRRKVLAKEKKNYILFFGRITKIKGVDLIADAAKALPDVEFLIAGEGDLKYIFEDLPNCKLVGFLEKESLTKLIEEAYLSVCPSICLENCPMSIAESIFLGTPVLGARIGGIPELIEENITGQTFTAMDAKDFICKIRDLCRDKEKVYQMSQNCLKASFLSCETYAEQIVHLYEKVINEM